MILIIKAGDTGSDSVVAQNDVVKNDKVEDLPKERPSRKNKKKEKEREKENVEKVSIKKQVEKRLLVLPMEASIIALLLLVLLGAFYVVRTLSLFSILNGLLG